jgi:hypothetical protein
MLAMIASSVVVVDAQEGRIEVLRAVRHEVERSHQHDRIDEQPRRLQERSPEVGRLTNLLALTLLPRRGFGNLRTDVDDQQRGRSADEEHPAPAEVRQDEEERDRGQQIARRISFLQQSREKAARLRRHTLERKCGADAPLAAHRDTEQCAQYKKRREVRREARCKFEPRIQEDVDHQRTLASETVRELTEDQRAQWPKHQG